MPVTEIKFEPKQGGESFTLQNVDTCSFGFRRQTAANGHVGMRGHEIDEIVIVRKKSLQEDGVAGLDDGAVKLAAALEKKAYFKGEVTMARDDDAANKVGTLRWDNGHICDYECVVSDLDIIERIRVCVTELMVDDVTVSRTKTT